MQVGRRSFLGGIAGVAGFWTGALQAKPMSLPEEKILRLAHPDLRPSLATLLETERTSPPWSLQTLPAKRNPLGAGVAASRLSVPVEIRMVPGLRGQPDVKVWIINRVAGSAKPAIVHMHGGGMITGDPRFELPYLQEIAEAVGCVIVSVQYRLAPESTFKDSTEDNYAALKYVHTNADQLGIDASRIGVMGESAGGGHAALLALIARDRGEFAIKFQFLMYPMLDDRTGSSKRIPWPMGEVIWNAAANQFGWSCFLGQPAGGVTTPRNSVPARANNLRDLPPAFITVGTLDLFCIEDIDYARRLQTAGVETELHVIPGAFHAFDGIARETALGRWMHGVKLDALRRGLA